MTCRTGATRGSWKTRSAIRPELATSIPATSKPHHLDDNMAAGTGPPLDEAARAKLIAILEG